MTTSTVVTSDDGTSARAVLDEWLLGSEQELASRVAQALSGPVAEGRAPAFFTRLAIRELRRVLPDSLVDLLVTGLKGHGVLQEAARDTLADGSTDADVALGRRTLHSTHTVDVKVVAGVLTTAFEIVVAVDFDVVDARAEVAAGRLRALSVRDPGVAGRVSARADGVETGELCRRTGVLRLGRRMDFDPALQILSEVERQKVSRVGAT
jgi:hypothetical protein